LILSVSGTPAAAFVDTPKLELMSLRTTPLSLRMLLVLPGALFEPSAG
jgi:hypothetical protein